MSSRENGDVWVGAGLREVEKSHEFFFGCNNLREPVRNQISYIS